MGNCSSSKRKIPVPTARKGSSSAIRKVLLDDSNRKENGFRRSLSRDEKLSATNIININIDPTKKKDDIKINNINNKEISNNQNNNNSLYSKNPKEIIIKYNYNNTKNNSANKVRSKEKIKDLKKNNIIKYIHIKNRSSSSKYETYSINSSSINNNYNSSQILKDKNNLKTNLMMNKVFKTGAKCKYKNRIPRSTFESNYSNYSTSNNRNCKIKFNRLYSNTCNDLNDENINIINKNIFNIYNNSNININFYQSKFNQHIIPTNRKNKNLYKCIKTIEAHQEKIASIIELSNGLIATGSYDCRIKIWDLEKSLCIKTINENGYIFCLLEMEQNMILSGTNKNTIQLYNLNSPTNTNENIFSFKGHDLWVNCLVKCNSQFFASGSNDSEIKIWDYEKKSLYKTLKGHEECVLSMILLNNEKLCSGSADLSIKIWDWRIGVCVGTLIGHDKWVKCLCQLDNGYLVSGSDDMTIKIWNDNKCIKEFFGHTHSVRTLCKIDKYKFASGSFDETIKIWSINSLETMQTLKGHKSYVISIIQISNGDLVSCSNDHSIKIWRK